MSAKEDRPCKGCGIAIPFRGWQSPRTYCTHQCSATHRSQLKDAECLALFENGELKSRPQIHKILVKRDGDQCSVCKITEWMGKPVRFWVDHIDGDATNNAPTNLRLICPTCDSQSETFGARNKGNGRKSRGLPSYG